MNQDLVSNKSEDSFSGDGSTTEKTLVQDTTAPLDTIDIDSTTNGSDIRQLQLPTGYRLNAGFVIGILLLILFVMVLIWIAYRRHKFKMKRRNNPYHVPIIEYKEDSSSVSTFHSVGYGTYRDLEEYPTTDDVTSKIEGKLTMQGLYSSDMTT